MKRNRLVIGLLTACSIIFLGLQAQATEGIRTVPVHFKKGASQATIQGHLKGRQTTDYVLRAREGQTMTVTLKTKHTAVYFNVLPPGSEEALFVGQTSGSHFEGKLPKDGEYRVRVYLVRAAARRQEAAKYTLTVKITGHEAAAAGKATDHQANVTDHHGKAFDRKLSLLGVSFHVTSPNAETGNTVTITPAGLKGDNSPIKHQIGGRVIGVEVADLNVDQSPEIYVYGREAGPKAPGVLVAYGANNKKSLSEIYLPPLSEHQGATAGYHGHDEMAVVESTFVRRFPIYGQGGESSSPTGKTRQLQYKLAAGEAGWVLKLDKMMEY
jgi:hypothetical protein